jgi:signal transduction histidine kinase
LLSDEALQALEEINRLWTVARIFSSTAHDVNNALQVISGSAELLEARQDIDATTLRRAQAIRGQAARATEAIDRLLRYTRDTGGSVRTVDVAGIVEAAVAMRAFTLNRAQITIETERSDEEPYRAAVDPPKILQLLLTLLLSFEQTLRSGSRGRITVRLDREPSLVVVTSTGDIEGGAAAGAGGGTPADPIGESQMTAVCRIAEGQRGTLTIDSEGGHLKKATLKLPGA